MKKRRVLHVLGAMNRGGAETMIMNVYRNIDRDKVQFDFAVHSFEKCDFDDEIIELGGFIYHYPRYKIKNHFQFLKFWKSFLQTHQEFSYIHCHTMNTAGIIMNLAKKYEIKRIIHSHNSSSGTGYLKYIKDFYRYPLKKNEITDFRFACGKEAGEFLYGTKDFTIITNAIPTDKFIFQQEIREKLRENLRLRDSFVIGNIARFNEVKNHVFLIDIFLEIYQLNKNAVLLLLGDGSLRALIEEKADKLGLKDRVIFTGVVDNPHEYLQAMDVFLFPSLYEGLPLSLIEAQTSGLHCITSDKVVPQEVKVTDLVDFISLEDSAEIWAKRVLAYNNGYERTNRKREIVEAGYDITEATKVLQNIYLEK